MKKRLLAFCLVLCICIGLLPTVAIAAPEENGDGPTAENPMTVPSEALTIKGTVIEEISQDWLDQNKPADGSTLYLKLTIPSHITELGDGYKGFRLGAGYSLQVDFSEATSLQKINNQAFMRATALQGVLDLSNTKITTIGKSAFSGCTGLTGVILPSTLEVLGTEDGKSGSVFNGCSGLQFVRTAGGDENAVFELPQGLRVIGYHTFQDTFPKGSDIKVRIPASVEIIGSQAFYSSSAFSQIYIERQSGYDGYDSNAFKATAAKDALLIFPSDTAYNDTGKFTRITKTYPVTLDFKKGEETVASQKKLYGQSIQYELGVDRYWYLDSDYTLPDIPDDAPNHVPGYDDGWQIHGDTKVLTNTSEVNGWPDASLDVTLTSTDVVSKPEVQFTVNGVPIENQTPGVNKLSVTLNEDGTFPTVGVQVTHPLATEEAKATGTYVCFDYCWWDESNPTPNGPRSQEEPELFSSAPETSDPATYNRVHTTCNEIPIRGIKDARTDGDYYLVEIYGYYVKDHGTPTQYYKSNHNFIAGQDGNAGEGFVMEVEVTEPKTITITPQDITAYTGGDSISEDTFPTARYTVKTGSYIEDLYDVVFTVDGKSYTISEADVIGTDGDGNDLYLLPWLEAEYTPAEDADTSATASSGEAADDDSEAGKYDIQVANTEAVSAKVDGQNVTLRFHTGTLTVRNVSDPDTVIEDVDSLVTEIVRDETAVDTSGGMAVAVIPEGAVFYTNGKQELGVLGTDAEDPEAEPQISLLFDDLISRDAIIDGDGVDTTQLLIEHAQASGYTFTDGQYQFKYLDLVNANDGNAWISTDQDLTIFWPYPDAVKSDYRNYTFQLLHFKGLHREYDVDTEEALREMIRQSALEDISVEATEQGLKFTLKGNQTEGSFSPFALTWTRNNTGGGTTWYTITASAGAGGSISPEGSVRVRRGSDRTFTITPAEGYEIADVLVDGVSIGAVSSYTFTNVTRNHTITAVFTASSGIADPDDTGVSGWLNTTDHMDYLHGYPGDLFDPDGDMTRAEAAQMFYNLLLDKDVAITASFTDVGTGAWYSQAVNTLASLGILGGVGEGRFSPERSITRAEFTAIAMRFAQLERGGESPFSDVHEGDWFYDVVVGAVRYGWIGGYPDGTFRPYDTISRAEAAAITNRMLGRSADEDYVDRQADRLRQFTDLERAHWAYYDIVEATNGHTYHKSGSMENWTGLD